MTTLGKAIVGATLAAIVGIAQLHGQLAQTQLVTEAVDAAFTQSAQAWKLRAMELHRRLEEMPDKQIPELEFLTENDWLEAARDAKLDTNADIRKAMRDVRAIAKKNLPIGRSLYSFTREHNGQLPTSLSQLKPYFKPRVTDSSYTKWLGLDSSHDEEILDAIFQRYTLLHTGNTNDFPAGTWIVVEKAAVDRDYDTRVKFGLGTSQIIRTGIGERGDPDDPTY